jgi:tetratricopeptide (TPR) repeat protein
MAGDARATVVALDAARRVFRTKIEEGQGRVIDMAGDAVLAVFDTALGAVTAALAVQSELAAAIGDISEERRMRFRIGIHLGDVIQKADGTVYGDGVNIAARLESLAEPGGIAISESIRVAVKGKIDATFTDEGSAKKALALDPDEATGHRALAMLMLWKRNYDDAESEGRTAVRLAPSDARGYVAVGSVLEFTGRYDEAIPNYEIARRLDPDLGTIVHFLGRAHFGRAYLASICGADYKHASWFDRFVNGLYAAEIVQRLDARPS